MNYWRGEIRAATKTNKDEQQYKLKGDTASALPRLVYMNSGFDTCQCDDSADGLRSHH